MPTRKNIILFAVFLPDVFLDSLSLNEEQRRKAKQMEWLKLKGLL
jgi:hypothetical protein